MYQESQSQGVFDPKYSFQFSEQSIRQSFVRKVFLLVTLMLGFVTILTIIPMASNDFRNWLYTNYWLSIVSIVVFLILSIVLSCCGSVRRNYPLNLICLAVFTLATGVMVMFVTATYNVQSVLICLCITTLCSASIIAFSMTTNYDLTSKIGAIYTLGMVVFFFGIFSMIFTLGFGWAFLNSVYSGIAGLLMMIYLALDIQLLMGGRKYELSPEEYVFAAMQIFLDIINIFLMLLNLFGKRD